MKLLLIFILLITSWSLGYSKRKAENGDDFYELAEEYFSEENYEQGNKQQTIIIDKTFKTYKFDILASEYYWRAVMNVGNIIHIISSFEYK
jgi:hypothetical protein